MITWFGLINQSDLATVEKSHCWHKIVTVSSFFLWIFFMCTANSSLVLGWNLQEVHCRLFMWLFESEWTSTKWVLISSLLSASKTQSLQVNSTNSSNTGELVGMGPWVFLLWVLSHASFLATCAHLSQVEGCYVAGLFCVCPIEYDLSSSTMYKLSL